MKSLKIRNCIICTSLALSLSLSANVYAYASQPNVEDNGIAIEYVDADTINVTQDNEQTRVTVSEQNGIRTITMVDLTSGKTDYIKYDQNSNTVYSSLTNETINLNENEELAPASTGNEAAAARSVSNYEIRKISYAQIKRIVGKVATAARVIGAILYFIPPAKAIGGAASAISTIVLTLNGSVKASSSHGIRLKVKVTKYYRTRAGKRHVYKITRSIASGSLY